MRTAPAGTTPRPASRELPDSTLAAFLVAPALLVLLAVAVLPILQAAWLSLHRIQLQFPQLGQPFVGWENYRELASSPRFWNALRVTGIFTITSVLLETVLGMILALLLHREFALRGWVRSAALVPWAFTTVVAALAWQFLYNDQFGIVNGVLLATGLLKHPVVWLGSTHTALGAAVVADVWKTTPFMALLLLAGLQMVPGEVLEAARVDGASRVQTFFRVVLPLLRPTLLVAVLFRTLDAFRVFDLIFVLTQGGPGNSTETLSYLTYARLFREFDFGTGSALAVLMFLCVLLISVFFLRVLGARPR